MSTDQIDAYTASDVYRTAFAYHQPMLGSLGAGLKNGINQVCICCKGGSTLKDGSVVGIVDCITCPAELKPWTDFYISGTKEYKAYKCRSCGYQWSWYRDKNAD